MREIEKRLPPAINRMLDRVNPRKRWQIQTIMLEKGRRRLTKLKERLEVLSLQGNEKEVRRFYGNMLNDPRMKKKLEEIRERKGRRQLLPSNTDLKILSEAIVLKASFDHVLFVSKDEDFCSFAEEIRKLFNIDVVAVQDLCKVKRIFRQICTT